MNKKIMALLAAAVLAASLGGCGEDPNAPRYAFVTDMSGIENEWNKTVWDVINAQAEPAEYKTISCTAESDTAEGYDAAFSEAVKAGAKLIFASGRAAGPYVYSAANTYSKVSFVLLDGEVLPAGEVTEETAIPENAVSMKTAWEQAGFAEGFAAVMNGYRNLAVIAGQHTEENERLVAGFMQGLETAASELGLGENAITVTLEYAGTDELTPLRMSEALDLYDAGVESIFVTSEGIGTAVARAAEVKGRTFFAGGCDLVEAEPTCLMGVTARLEKACVEAVRIFESEAGFSGGIVMDCGFGEDCLVTSADYARFASFSEEDCRTMTGKIAGGTYRVSSKWQAKAGGAVAVTEQEAKGGQ